MKLEYQTKVEKAERVSVVSEKVIVSCYDKKHGWMTFSVTPDLANHFPVGVILTVTVEVG